MGPLKWLKMGLKRKLNDMRKQKITIVGIGYVGLGVGVMLATKHDVMMLDVDQKKVDMLNDMKSPIKDPMIEEYLAYKNLLTISATTSPAIAYKDPDFVIVSVPTNYDEEKKEFDTHIVENVVNEPSLYKDA